MQQILQTLHYELETVQTKRITCYIIHVLHYTVKKIQETLQTTFKAKYSVHTLQTLHAKCNILNIALQTTCDFVDYTNKYKTCYILKYKLYKPITLHIVQFKCFTFYKMFTLHINCTI